MYCTVGWPPLSLMRSLLAVRPSKRGSQNAPVAGSLNFSMMSRLTCVRGLA